MICTAHPNIERVIKSRRILCLCILIVMYVLFCIFCFHRANWHSSATLTEVFPVFFFSVVRQMPGYNSQRRGTARTLPTRR
jgi:hypothetical protein